VPDDGIGAGPDGCEKPAQILSEPHERSTRPTVPVVSTWPSGYVVASTIPGVTSIVVRTRPDGDLASTIHGKGGSAPTSIVGTGPPGANVATCRPFTKTLTVRVVPFETPSGGRSEAAGTGVCSKAEQDDAKTIARSTRRPVTLIAQRSRIHVCQSRPKAGQVHVGVEVHRPADIDADGVDLEG
jgi:hypothetical protein